MKIIGLLLIFILPAFTQKSSHLHSDELSLEKNQRGPSSIQTALEESNHDESRFRREWKEQSNSSKSKASDSPSFSDRSIDYGDFRIHWSR